MIVGGIYIAIRHSFRNPVWIILITVGTIFLINEFDPEIEIKKYTLPIVIILFGLFMIIRPRHRRFHDRWKSHNDNEPKAVPPSEEDALDSVIIFSGTKKNIISKNFRGGEIVTLFGGTELNLTQSDINGQIELDLTQLFGGTKLIVPPHWIIKYEEIVSIFGGVDDKRAIQRDVVTDTDKVLVLKGTCIFGGIDIRSF
jgi:hypothetical protein